MYQNGHFGPAVPRRTEKAFFALLIVYLSYLTFFSLLYLFISCGALCSCIWGWRPSSASCMGLRRLDEMVHLGP